VFILMIAFFVVYMPYAAITAESAVSTVDKSLEEAAAVSGAKEVRRIGDIVLPLIVPGLFAAWALVFVRIIGDLPLAVLLGNARTATIGYLLLDVFEQGTFGTVAALSLIMTIIAVPIVGIMLWLGTPRWKRSADKLRKTTKKGST
jgi:iron(III) transport system permease protein